MKYQQYVVARRCQDGSHDLRRFRTKVIQSGEAWLPDGAPIEEHPTPADMLLDIGEYEDSAGDFGPLTEITPPDGWTVVARLWLPDNYVPESQEVADEHRKRAIAKLRSMGLWRDE